MKPSCPACLWLVRPGQAAAAAPEADPPLTPLGTAQAAALGGWFAGCGARPTVVLASPARRARETAEALAAAGGFADADVEVRVDERLRERDLGALRGVPGALVRERFPEEAARQRATGELGYRPPGGESVHDLLLRLRSLLDGLWIHHPGERVLVLAHETAILAARYVLEGLSAEELLALLRARELANCSVTAYRPCDGTGHLRVELERYNFVAPLVAAGAPVTRRADPRPGPGTAAS